MNAALRFAVRSLRRTPGFTVLAIAILTLGIGATTAMFSITDTVLFKPLQYRDPGQLASLMLKVPVFSKYADRIPLNAYHYRFFKQHSRTLKQIALLGPTAAILSGAGKPVAVQGISATPELFDLLGVQPRLGRGFLAQESEEGKNHVIILGNALWRSQFNADPHVLGRKIRLDGEEYQVVGITSPSFPFPSGRQLSDVESLPEHSQYWIPLTLTRDDLARPDGGMKYFGLVRLKPGVPLSQAYAELAAGDGEIVRQFHLPFQMYPLLEPLRASLANGVREPLLLLFGAVGLVLLIVCVNLMNLMLVRASARRREWAVRLAVGAGLGQILRDNLAESLLLSLTGGLLGSLLAAWLVALVRASAPFDLPRVNELHIDLGSLAFALGISIFSAVLFGLWPAWRSTKTDPQEVLQSSSRSATEGRKGNRLGRTLVAVQVALSVVVLLGAGLFLHSFVRILQVNPGVQIQHVMTASIQLPPDQYKTAGQTAQFYQRLIEDMRTLPEIKEAGVTTQLALTSATSSNPYYAGDRPIPPIAQRPMVNQVWTSTTYFGASGVPLMAGRIFQQSDGTRRVAVISQNLADQLWPHENAIGRPLQTFNLEHRFDPFRVVGVVGSVHGSSLTKQAENMIYMPYWQDVNTGMSLVVRTTGDPHNAAGAIRSVVARLDPRVPVSDVRRMQDLVDSSMTQRRFQLFILIAFAGMALVLACLGIYGVLSFNVGQRTGEMGIRMALGARPGQIRGLILRQGMVPVVAGLLTGVTLSAVLGRVVQSLLFGVEALDPVTYVLTSVMLLVVALLACLIPARRAARLNPLEALRNE